MSGFSGRLPGRPKRIAVPRRPVREWSVPAFARGFLERLDAFNAACSHFGRGGLRGVFFSLASAGFTLGLAGLVVLFALAQPAMRETAGDWRNGGNFSVTFLDRQGREIGSRGVNQRASVPVAEMPDVLIKAVLATEDRRFLSHHGIDFGGMLRAALENVRANDVVQGGSSITQQLAKNLFLGSERTLERKIKEAFLALWLEANLSKTEILQLYLDRVYMGGGTFGISAASDFYFGKDVRNLDLAEAAMLAGLFKAPTRYAPHADIDAARARADTVLSNLVDAGFMSHGAVLAARLHPASVVPRPSTVSPDYFLDFAFDEAKSLGTTHNLRSFVARTTIDLDLQRATEQALESGIEEQGEKYGVREGAIVLLDTDGSVRAIVGGRDYGASQFNRATQALRQTGSSFKPYVYAVAMEHGFTPGSMISDGPISWGGWSPKNYSRAYAGKVTLATALVKSINTVPVRLARDSLSLSPIVAMAAAMGVESPLNGHKTLVLGTSGMTVMDQATGYNTFANGGFSGTRHAIAEIATRAGQVVYQHDRDAAPPRRVLSEQALAAMNSMLSQVPEIGTAKRAALAGIRSAGKTGTTSSYRDAWYVGFTGNFTAAVWLGNDDFTPTKAMTGGTLPALIWKRLMTYAHQSVALKPIPGISDPLLDDKQVDRAAAKSMDTPPLLGEHQRTASALSGGTASTLQAMNVRFREASGRFMSQLSDGLPSMRSSLP